MNRKLIILVAIFFVMLCCPAFAFMGGHYAQESSDVSDNPADDSTQKNVMRMIIDLGGQANIAKNNRKTFNCIHRGTKKVSIITKGETTTFIGDYNNCREYGEIRDGIFEIKVVNDVIEKDSVHRSINGELFDAVVAKDSGKVKKLIKENADVNYTENVNSADYGEITEWSVLMQAVITRDLNAVEQLVNSGAWVNYMNGQASTALWLAAAINQLDILKFLVKHGAYINNSNFENVTPLMLASINGNIEMVQYLISHRAELDSVQKDGDSALMFSLARGHNKIAQLLIKSGANIQIRNKFGISALLIAAAEGNIDMVAELINRKADLKATSDTGKTALDIAEAKGYSAIVNLLKRSAK